MPGPRRIVPTVLSDVPAASFSGEWLDYAACRSSLQCAACRRIPRGVSLCGIIGVMKIVALDGSPNAEKGNTAMLLARFLAGASEAGADVERVSVYKLRMEPCCARVPCWHKTPGVCIYNDDVSALMGRMAHADVWVLSSPVHVGGMTHGLTRVMERSIMLLSPHYELGNDGRTRHVTLPCAGDRMMVLISTCGLYEEDAIAPLVAQVEDLSRSHGRRFAGALLRPHGLALRFMKANGLDVEDVLQAAHDAGRELVRTGSMSEETLQKVRRPLISRDDFIAMMNSAFDRRLGSQGGRQGIR
jgi:multimeric flavodoxin WrbA